MLVVWPALLVPLVVVTSPDRPAWEQPDNGVRLEIRDVVADPRLPIPVAGQGVYVFTTCALSRTQVDAAAQVGLRYLGVIATSVYAFVVETLTDDATAFLAAQDNVLGTALAAPVDRLQGELLAHYADGSALPHPITVKFWSRATAAEVRALIPNDIEQLRLPTDPAEFVREESFAILSAASSTVDVLRTLAKSAVVGSIGFEYPKKLTNEDSRALSNAGPLSRPPFELDGTGVLVGHWDGGSVSSSHRDFGGRVDNRENASASSHATHTAGTILGSGTGDSAARGYAPQARMVAYTFYGDATAERRAAKHAHYHEHDNHSWGSTNSAYGGYSQRARSFDLDVRDLLMLGVKSAGNEGSSSEISDRNYGFDSLSDDSTCKNMIVIGATQDNGDLVGFSSRGPTNDGRLKPDISANGSNLYSTMPNGRYGNMSGTSMSAPSVTGMIALLSELWKRQHGRRWAPDMIRTVMIHTVTDVFHTGPDYRHGWGNADVHAAANLITADATSEGRQLVRGAVRDGETVEYELDVPAAAAELKVTLTWLDATSGGTAQRRLINDLDLELVSPSGDTRFPWTLDPSNPFDDAVRTVRNSRDNAEQVLVDTPQTGRWTVRVKGQSISDPDLPVQGFVIASSHGIDRAIERLSPADLPPNGLDVPDGDSSGVELRFLSTDAREIKSLRLHLDVAIEERGDLRVDLIHPDGTRVTVEGEDTSTRRDIFAIFPDLRSYEDDVTLLHGKVAVGEWKVRVVDTSSGNSGTVLGAMLEIEFDGAIPPPQNNPPSANASKDQTAGGGDVVMLDGSMSADPDGDPLVFSWQQQAGIPVTLDDPTAAQPSFTAPSLGQNIALVFRLTVDDQRGGTSSDDVTVSVGGSDPGSQNNDPVARTNGDQFVAARAVFTLDATPSSDPDGDLLSFRWTQIAGIEVPIDDPSLPTVSLTAPDAADQTQFVFRLEVDDGRGGVDLAEVRVTLTSDPTMLTPVPQITEAPKKLFGQLNGGCGCGVSTPVDGRPAAWWLGLIAGLLLARRRR